MGAKQGLLVFIRVDLCSSAAPAFLSIRDIRVIRGCSLLLCFTREFGWLPGVNHSVVLLGVNRKQSATIADPAFDMCREQWDGQTLRTLWQGYAFQLVPR